MLEIIKIANEIKTSNDMIITAGFLSRLKNKIVNFFSKDKREEAAQMVEQTNELKPKLVETYEAIKSIEDAIEDLDVKKYEEEVVALQPKIDDLVVTVKKLVALTNEPRYRADFSNLNYVDKYRDGDTWYKDLNSFGKQFGLDMQGSSIVGTRTGVKSLFSSWAAAVFTGKLRQNETGQFSPGEFESEHDDPKEFSELQDKVSDSEMANAFYKDLPFYPINSIKPRETRVVDSEDTRVKKKGEVEVFLTSPWITVPAPADNWRLKVNFVIVDKGNPTEPNNFVIYRQWVVGAKKVS